MEVYPESAKKELLSKPEVYALLNDSDKKDLDDHDNIVFTSEILDTSQEEVKNNEKTTDLFKKDETEFDWDDI